jgi:hypothetical protein
MKLAHFSRHFFDLAYCRDCSVRLERGGGVRPGAVEAGESHRLDAITGRVPASRNRCTPSLRVHRFPPANTAAFSLKSGKELAK